MSPSIFITQGSPPPRPWRYRPGLLGTGRTAGGERSFVVCIRGRSPAPTSPPQLPLGSSSLRILIGALTRGATKVGDRCYGQCSERCTWGTACLHFVRFFFRSSVLFFRLGHVASSPRFGGGLVFGSTRSAGLLRRPVLGEWSYVVCVLGGPGTQCPRPPELGAPAVFLVWVVGALLLQSSLGCCWHIDGRGQPLGLAGCEDWP